jgi:predicted RND superfamily exporter protein
MTDPEFMERFNDFAQSIDPEVTGLPITFLAWGVLLRDGLERSAVYAALIILLLLLVDFRALRPTLLALFPIVLGLVWMVGAMNAFDIGYNFANVIAIPLILGIGIDSGVHVVHRWLQGTAPTDLPATTGKAVIVSSLTTIIGFGALLASDHGGIRSLGLTLTIGVAASMIGASLVLPALLEAIRRLREPR